MISNMYPSAFCKVLSHPQYLKVNLILDRLRLREKSATFALLKHITLTQRRNCKKNKEFYDEKKIEVYAHIEKNIGQFIEASKVRNKGMMTLLKYKKCFFGDLDFEDMKHKLNSPDQLVPKGFLRMKSGTYDYEIDGTLKPSDALDHFLASPTIHDSGSAIEALLLKTIKDCIPNERFNALFSHPDFLLRITEGNSLQPHSILHTFTVLLPRFDKGARCYYPGVPLHELKHATNTKKGYVAICLDSEPNQLQSWSLGCNQTMSLQEIETLILDRYNKDCPFHTKLPKILNYPPKQAALIKETRDPSSQHIFDLNVKLGFPDLTLREARQLGAGVEGDKIIDTLSVEILDLINSVSMDMIQDKKFPTYLYCQSLKIQYLNYLKNISLFLVKEPIHDVNLWRY
ncbi:MAG: hypothetical protein EBZ47_03050 [Chlamydiae bacterium]|nr:hypothetical protein [Chlamydiota bacterium]